MLKRLTVLSLSLTLAVGASASRAGNNDASEVGPIISMVIDNRCGDAVVELNKRLPQGDPKLLILAGSMYETGTCLNQDWEKSALLYQQAIKGEAEMALPRLVALYAVHGRDPAAALWWAAQRPALLPKACVPTADPLKSSEAFVDELRTWPAARLSACTYHAGVTFRMLSDTTNRRHFGHTYDAKINVQLNLVNGTIEWFDVDERRTVVSRLLSDSLDADPSSRPQSDAFRYYLWWVGIRALQEFGKPPSKDPSWTSQNTFTIERNFSRSGIPTQIGLIR